MHHVASHLTLPVAPGAIGRCLRVGCCLGVAVRVKAAIHSSPYRFWRRSWIGLRTHLGRQKGAKTEPKTRPGGLKTTQEAAKTAHEATEIEHKIVFKNDRVLERS